LKGARFVQKYGVIKEAFKALALEDDDAPTEQGSDSDELTFFHWDSLRHNYKGD
jgi:hypothetical protein